MIDTPLKVRRRGPPATYLRVMPTPTARRDQVAENVRAALARRQLSAAALAPRVGMSQQAMSRRTTGKIPFDVDELQRIADALEVDFADLAGDRVPA